jgi:hypothetical protein
MRRLLSALLACTAAATLGACKPAAGPGAASAQTFACVTTIGGKTATCMRFANVAGGPGVVARLKQGCLVVPGQTFGPSCPAGGLVGCCTMRHPGRGDAATCFYAGGPLMATPEQCVKDGGVWSAAP